MITPELEYIPKGGMCGTCQKQTANCSQLDFASMPKIGKGHQDGLVVVRCIEFERRITNE